MERQIRSSRISGILAMFIKKMDSISASLTFNPGGKETSHARAFDGMIWHDISTDSQSLSLSTHSWFCLLTNWCWMDVILRRLSRLIVYFVSGGTDPKFLRQPPNHLARLAVRSQLTSHFNPNLEWHCRFETCDLYWKQESMFGLSSRVCNRLVSAL